MLVSLVGFAFSALNFLTKNCAYPITDVAADIRAGFYEIGKENIPPK